jgi:hypothetical protein
MRFWGKNNGGLARASVRNAEKSGENAVAKAAIPLRKLTEGMYVERMIQRKKR